MGRFDALTQLEEKQDKTVTPPPAVHSPTTNTQPTQSLKKQTEVVKKPANPKNILRANPQTRKTESKSPTLSLSETLEKYTTRLEPSLIKKIRIHAAEKDLKDYQVVKIALNQFFEKNK